MKAKWLVLALVLLGLVVAPSVGFSAAPTIQNAQSSAFVPFPAVPNLGLTTGVNGELGLYLVGPWDNRAFSGEAVYTRIQLVNPTSTNKWAFVTFWSPGDFSGPTPPASIGCTKVQLFPNGYAEVDLQDDGGSGFHWGAVKVLVTNDAGEPDIGLVGYKRQFRTITNTLTTGAPDTVNVPMLSDVRLQPVPPKVVFSDRNPAGDGPDEILAIKAACP